MCMTPSSNRLNIVISFSSTSTLLTPHIQFTTENPKDDGSISFLDTLVSLRSSNTLITPIQRKPTHTDQYLYLYSNYNLPAKYSIYNTLAHRERVVCTSQLAAKEEENYIMQALLRCNYPQWALNRLHTKSNHKSSTNPGPHVPDSRQQTNNNNGKTKNHNIF